jgi:hypothetical protein
MQLGEFFVAGVVEGTVDVADTEERAVRALYVAPSERHTGPFRGGPSQADTIRPRHGHRQEDDASEEERVALL